MRDAKWFYNFFSSKDNWCVGYLEYAGARCAVGHLTEMDAHRAYDQPIVKECNLALGITSIVDVNDDQEDDPKPRILKACRKAILRDDPDCQLGKEYDDV